MQRPLPDITPRMEPFWQGAARGELMIQRCRGCGEHRFPAVEICSACLSDSLEWVQASGRATLFSFVVMHQVYHPAFADEAPYAVADVRLAEGPHMISRVADVEAVGLEIGMQLTAEFERRDEHTHMPRFRRTAP